jgi:hypothetical protein
MIESVMLTCVIDAFEGSEVATVDIPRSFLQADMDKTVYVRMTNTVIGMLSIIDRMYDKYNNHEGTRKTLYVKLHKALYGTLRKALLFYKKISQQPQEWRFKINPYDSCIYNKQIDEYQ